MATIFTKDALRASVEAATGGRMTVLYTAKGQPTYMTRIPAFNLEDIDASLGTGLHPAFKVGGQTKSELFIGTYQGIVKNGELLSLPGVDPSTYSDFDTFVGYARAAGAGHHVMTNAEWAAVALWSWKNGTMPRGNSNYGRDVDSKWETGVRQDGAVPGDAQGSARVLTGSGPMSWRHDNTPAGVSDMNGNVWEWSTGLRLVEGEIQIIADNDAALDSADFGVGSTQWRAILAADGSLVAPGTAGTLKYDSTSDSQAAGRSGDIVLSDAVTKKTGPQGDGSTSYGYSATILESVTTKAGLTPPVIAAQLGLFPVDAGLGGDYLYVRNYGERLPIRGGGWYNGANAGVFCLHLYYARSPRSSIGARPAFVL